MPRRCVSLRVCTAWLVLSVVDMLSWSAIDQTLGWWELERGRIGCAVNT